MAITTVWLMNAWIKLKPSAEMTAKDVAEVLAQEVLAMVVANATIDIATIDDKASSAEMPLKDSVEMVAKVVAAKVVAKEVNDY